MLRYSLPRCGLLRRTVKCLVPSPLTDLQPEEAAMVNSVRDFCLQEIAPRSRQMDKEGHMDQTIIHKLFEAGLFGMEAPHELGGGGMNFFSSILAIEEVARHDPGIATAVDVHNTVVSNVFLRYANAAQQKKYLPKLTTDTLGSFCLTESGSGSDAFALKTSAKKKADRWVLNGSKVFITNGAQAGVFLVMATVDSSKGYKGITCFIVDTSETEGVTVVREEDKLGIRSSSTAEIHFQDVAVPEENVIGEVGKGYQIAIGILNEGRVGIGAQMLGVAQGALDVVMPYLFQRKQFGSFIGDFQGMQMQYAECFTELEAARLLVYNTARKQEKGDDLMKDAAMAKYFASVVAEKTASRAVEWAGGIGFMRDFGLERFYRDAKIGSIYEGTSIIQLQTIAKMVKKQYQ